MKTKKKKLNWRFILASMVLIFALSIPMAKLFKHVVNLLLYLILLNSGTIYFAF